MEDKKMAGSDLESKVFDIISREGMVERDKITRTSTLDDLDIQSIDMVMVLQGIEEEFGIYVPMDETVMELGNAGQVVDAIAKLLAENGTKAS